MGDPTEREALKEKVEALDKAIRETKKHLSPDALAVLEDKVFNLNTNIQWNPSTDYTEEFKACKRELRDIWKQNNFTPDPDNALLSPFIKKSTAEKVQGHVEKRAGQVVEGVTGVASYGKDTAKWAVKGGVEGAKKAYGTLFGKEASHPSSGGGAESASPPGATRSATQTKEGLERRGEKLGDLKDKTDNLENAAGGFADAAEALRKKQEAKAGGGFFSNIFGGGKKEEEKKEEPPKPSGQRPKK